MKSESFLQYFYHADQTASRKLFFNLIVTGLCACTTANIGRVSKNKILVYTRTFLSAKIEALFQVFDLNKHPRNISNTFDLTLRTVSCKNGYLKYK